MKGFRAAAISSRKPRIVVADDSTVAREGIAAITGVIALRLAPTGRFLAIPFVALALLALIGGIVGHRHSLFVSLVMLGQAIGVWLATRRRRMI